MKLKSIIACGALLLTVGAATTSCEDMFTAENKLVTTDLTPQDTVYQVMGIIQRMQKLADRTVLLGELRGDLVDVDPAHSSVHLQELAANNVSDDNIYNQPADYYAVINNCNIYLAHVDSLLKAHGSYYYKNEIIAVKTFRAWCYLELAKIYGEVPYVTEPILTATAAEDIVASGQKYDLVTIADKCIQDLKAYGEEPENLALRPGYAANSSYAKYFIPVRVMLAELYLWKGSFTNDRADYINAIRMYHDFLTFPNEERATGRNTAEWTTSTFKRVNDMNYTPLFDYGQSYSQARQDWLVNAVAVLPLETNEFYGTVCDLNAIFNATEKQNYYPAVAPSARMDSISRGQRYCYYQYTNPEIQDTLYNKTELNSYDSDRMIGDLRLYSLFNTESVNNKYDASLNNERTYNAKYTGGNSFGDDSYMKAIPFYRYSTLYLHMAEALNCAGFPEAAFAVLKYGLTDEVMFDRDKISYIEFKELGKIKSSFTINYLWAYEDSTLNNSFLNWNPAQFVNIEKNVPKTNSENTLTIYSGASTYQVGIHSFGSGDSEYNKYYTLPVDESRLVEITWPEAPEYDEDTDDADSTLYKAALEQYEEEYLKCELQEALNEINVYDDSKEMRMKYVAERILDEEALENSFEGTRFYDLMRYVRQNGDNSRTIAMPAYIEKKYGPATKTISGKSWYLNLPKR